MDGVDHIRNGSRRAEGGCHSAVGLLRWQPIAEVENVERSLRRFRLQSGVFCPKLQQNRSAILALSLARVVVFGTVGGFGMRQR